MSATLNRIVDIVSSQSGLPRERLRPGSAIDQDARVSGDDVTEFVETLANEFGDDVWSWPWQRFAELSEPHLFTGFWFLWRLLTWPLRKRLFDPRRFERLELGHIAAVIDRGGWFEP